MSYDVIASCWGGGGCCQRERQRVVRPSQTVLTRLYSPHSFGMELSRLLDDELPLRVCAVRWPRACVAIWRILPPFSRELSLAAEQWG